MPPTVAITGGASPWKSTETIWGRLSKAGLRSGRAEPLGVHVRLGHVVLVEAERTGDLEPLTAVVQLLELGVERADERVVALAEHEGAGRERLLAVDHREEPLGDLDRGARVLRHHVVERDVGQR